MNRVAGKTIVCVSAVVMREDRMLLVRQSAGHPLAGQWTLPWGRVEGGESPVAAVVREIREEGGIEAAVEGLLGVQELPDPWSGWVAIVYVCRHVAGTPHPEDPASAARATSAAAARPRGRSRRNSRASKGGETDAARYFSRGELGALDEPIEPWSRWLAARVFDGRFTVTPGDPTNPLEAPGTYL